MSEFNLSGEALHGYDPTPHQRTLAMSAPHGVHTVKLGRKKPKATRASLPLDKYLTDELLSTLPVEFSWMDKAQTAIDQMYGNDRWGDCVIASLLKIFGVASGNDAGKILISSTQEAYDNYQEQCGPGDNGCSIADSLDFTRDHGIKINGIRRKIDGYVRIDWTRPEIVKAAIYLFCNNKFGINLPSAWQSASIWGPTSSPIIGGHDVPAFAWNAQGVIIASWARKYLVTWEALAKGMPYFDEAYVVLLPDWYGADNLSPGSFKSEALRADLQLLSSGTVPPLVPVTPPPVTPPPLVLPARKFKGSWSSDDIQVSFEGEFKAGEPVISVLPASASRKK